MQGVCKLTQTRGKFVKAHLIPHALTKPEVPGEPLIQFGRGEPSVRRWSSWYDQKLVTNQGETILRDLDTWAISFLRQQKLVWSGWRSLPMLPGNKVIADQAGWGIKSANVPDPSRFRMFLYSLLWRSAATSLREFREIVIPDADLEKLRLALMTGELPSISFYPASLIQLSTIGDIHNHSPISQVKTTPAIGSEPERRIPIFRFYFDGLIIHFHRQSKDDGHAESLGPLIVGNEARVTITTVTYEKSFQRENLMVSAIDHLERLGRTASTSNRKPRLDIHDHD